MKEYEYSVRVNDIKPFLDYCKKNGYLLNSESKQNRIVYENRNNRKILARITTVERNGEKITIFDCKNVECGDSSLKVSKENFDNIVEELEASKAKFDVVLKQLETSKKDILLQETKRRPHQDGRKAYYVTYTSP